MAQVQIYTYLVQMHAVTVRPAAAFSVRYGTLRCLTVSHYIHVGQSSRYVPSRTTVAISQLCADGSCAAQLVHSLSHAKRTSRRSKTRLNAQERNKRLE